MPHTVYIHVAGVCLVCRHYEKHRFRASCCHSEHVVFSVSASAMLQHMQHVGASHTMAAHVTTTGYTYSNRATVLLKNTDNAFSQQSWPCMPGMLPASSAFPHACLAMPCHAMFFFHTQTHNRDVSRFYSSSNAKESACCCYAMQKRKRAGMPEMFDV